MAKKTCLLWLMCFSSLLLAETPPESATAPTTQLVIQNRSGYRMVSALWRNGVDCSARLLQNAPVDINSDTAPVVAAPAGTPMAVGVAIHDLSGKTPVMCDYIVSFNLSPGKAYRLEFDVHDRRCFGQLFRQEASGNYRLVLSGDPDHLIERFPEFGWDQFEPGCAPE